MRALLLSLLYHLQKLRNVLTLLLPPPLLPLHVSEWARPPRHVSEWACYCRCYCHCM